MLILIWSAIFCDILKNSLNTEDRKNHAKNSEQYIRVYSTLESIMIKLLSVYIFTVIFDNKLEENISIVESNRVLRIAVEAKRIIILQCCGAHRYFSRKVNIRYMALQKLN